MSSRDMKSLLKNQVKKSVHAALIEPVTEVDISKNTSISTNDITDIDTCNNDCKNTNINTNNNVCIDTDVNISKVNYMDNYKSKPLFTDLHTRQTYYIENDILKDLNDLVGDNKRMKSKFVNDALREYIKLVTAIK